jgi:imidazolonepropionase-like amidohydrolase
MNSVRLAVVVAAWLVPALAWAQPAKPAAETTVYRGATLIDGTGAPARTGLDLVVTGEKIIAVAPSAPPPPGAKLVDARGLFVLPGLIDSHVHMATPPDRALAEATMRRQLYSGVTAVRDMADDVRSIAELARASRMGEIAGPDVYYAALMAGPSFFDDPRTAAAAQDMKPGTAPWMQAVDPSTDMRMAVALARGTSATAIKIYANLEGDMVAKIAEEARRQGMKVWVHGMVFPAPPSAVLAARPDVVSHTCYLAYEFSAKKPQSYQDPTPVDASVFGAGEHVGMAGLFARMKADGAILDATNRVYVESERQYARTGKGRPPRCPSKLAFDLTAQAWRAGVPISAGTDGETDWRDPYPSLHEELELLARDVGMPPLEVIRSATQVGAMTLGRPDEMGVIAPGKLANLVFVSKDPTVDIANLRSVAFTVKRGRLYKREDFKPITAEEAERP